MPHAQIGLTEKVVKDLQERSLEKRLSAATIIERDIEERLRDNDYASVSTRILYFKQLTQDFSNITNRRSGLFGLSFVGMAIYHKLRVSKIRSCICFGRPLIREYYFQTEQPRSVLLGSCQVP